MHITALVGGSLICPDYALSTMVVVCGVTGQKWHFADEANIGLVLLINAESSAINGVIPAFYEHLTNTL